MDFWGAEPGDAAFGARPPRRPESCSVPGVRPGRFSGPESTPGSKVGGFSSHSEHMYPGLAHVSRLLVSAQENGPVSTSRGLCRSPACTDSIYGASCTRGSWEMSSLLSPLLPPSGCSHPRTWQSSSLSHSRESLHAFAHRSAPFPACPLSYLLAHSDCSPGPGWARCRPPCPLPPSPPGAASVPHLPRQHAEAGSTPLTSPSSSPTAVLSTQ